MGRYLDLFIKNAKKRLDGRSQSWLADKAGMQESAISRTLSGKSEPMFEAACKIAEAVGSTVDELTEVSPGSDILTKKIGELTIKIDDLKANPLLKAYDEATPEMQRSVRQLLGLEENPALARLRQGSAAKSKTSK